MNRQRVSKRANAALAGTALLAVTAAPTAAAPTAAAPPPNIVFILADDLGGRDIGCYGSTFHKTPHIDALAKRGMLFRNAYSASPLCSPTRASILTGLAPARIGITEPNGHIAQVILEKRLTKGGPNQRVLSARGVTRLKTDYLTLPKVLRRAGYATGHFGKWHLGAEPYSPLQHGFDVDLPHTPGPGPGGGNGYFAPWQFWKGQGQPGDNIEDRMADEAVKFMRANKARPFFLNYWAFSVHSPWMTKDDYIAEAVGRADPKAAQRNPVYAGMIRSLDDAVGRLTATLDELKLTKNTIVIFTSDNGAWHNVAREATNKPEFAEVPVTSNAPLRSGKASNYEGGTRVPLLVTWPGHIAPASTSDAIMQSVDFFPTLVEITKSAVPAGTKFDGISIAPALRGQPLRREAIFSHFPHSGRTDIDGFRPATWVRHGDWKLIRFFADNADGSDLLELYNLREDIGETKNRAAENPRLVAELNALITGFLKDTDAVVPTLNPNFGKSLPASNAGNTVSGWRASSVAQLVVKDGSLHLTSNGTDPFIAANELPPATGPYIVELRMRSTLQGQPQLFWATQSQPPFAPARSLEFAAQALGVWNDYTIKLPETAALRAIRIDPGTTQGEVAFDWIRLKDAQGKLIRAWEFN